MVDKAVLLEVVDQISEEYSPTKAEFANQLRQLAGEKDIKTWHSAIALWMQHSSGQAVSLIQLQQALGMPLIEIWLGLLLREQNHYQWETDEEFDHDAGEL